MAPVTRPAIECPSHLLHNKLASRLDRVIAAVMDHVICIFFMTLLYVAVAGFHGLNIATMTIQDIMHNTQWMGALFVGSTLYYVPFMLRYCSTPGQYIIGLKYQNDLHQPPAWPQLLTQVYFRLIYTALLPFLLLLDVCACFATKKRQTFTNRLARLIVVER